MSSEMGEWLTIKQAAMITGRHPQTVRGWVRAGHLDVFCGRVRRQQVLMVHRRMVVARRTGRKA